ncbi:hypothetical protein JHK86_000212 [Glycine max]|nr:hypothetical protein JHK86_000212 [Glycine max]
MPQTISPVQSDMLLGQSWKRKKEEELEKQKAHERYMRLQEQGKTQQKVTKFTENITHLEKRITKAACFSGVHVRRRNHRFCILNEKEDAVHVPLGQWSKARA